MRESDIEEIIKNKDEKKLVLAMAQEYDDAGILPTDSLATAQQKLKGSKIYQKKVKDTTVQSCLPRKS